MKEQNISNEGFVTLAGAGPGDAELITLKLQKRLTEADVIITDRLVNPDIISAHARKDALILFAGKQGYNDSSFSQEDVTTLIVEHAQQGKKVLRLKGGDAGNDLKRNIGICQCLQFIQYIAEESDITTF